MKVKHHLRASKRKKERGNVLAYTVLSALFLFLAVGLGVDLSHLYSAKAELQNAADAAALAGASALVPGASHTRITTAVDRAIDILNKNKYNFNNKDFEDQMPLEDQRDLVEFSTTLDSGYVDEGTATANDTGISFVRVKTPTVPVTMFFAAPILGGTQVLSATATAGLSIPSNVFCNFIPIAAVEGAFGGGIGWDGGTCNPPPPAPGETPEECDPHTKFCPGCKYKIVAGPGDWHDTSPGNYQLLDAGEGGNAVKYAIAGGTTQCITSKDEADIVVETEPGRKTGPVEKGLNTRFDIYQAFGAPNVTISGVTKTIEEAFPPDPNIHQGGPTGKKDPPPPGLWKMDYNTITLAPSHTSQADRRQIAMPIINENQFDPGKDDVKFNRVGKFFLNKAVDGNGNIFAEYIGPAALSGGGFDPSGGNTSNVVVPVLYK
jgi:Flp pilus assembly protein TadG